jgi:hypothetical protein
LKNQLVDKRFNSFNYFAISHSMYCPGPFSDRTTPLCFCSRIAGVTHSFQAGAEHFQQCAVSLPLDNRGLGPLAVTVLAIPLARRAAATVCAAV